MIGIDFLMPESTTERDELVDGYLAFCDLTRP
jgi:hypothetical protein